MAHDGQNQFLANSVVVEDLLNKTARSVGRISDLLEAAVSVVGEMVSDEHGYVSSKSIDDNQTATHGLAWLATYVEALKQMQKWAEKIDTEGRFGETEKLITQIAFGEYLSQLYGGIPMNQTEIIRLSDIGLKEDELGCFLDPAVHDLMVSGNNQKSRTRLVELMQENSADIITGSSGLDEELEMIREQ